MDILQIKKAIQSLSSEERKKLLSDINIEHYESGDYVKNAISEKENRTPISCPHCNGSEVVSFGNHKGIKKYRCKACKKYFSGNYGTAIHWIHKKEKWQQYVECMNEGLSLKKSAEKVGISYRTSFIWRHKILSSLKDAEPLQLGGIVEADDTFFRYSEKGSRKLKRKPRKRGSGNMTLRKNKVPVVVVTDRKGNTLLGVARRGSVKRNDLRTLMKGKFHPDAILCSDGANVYKGLAIQEGIKHVKSSSFGRPIAKNKAYNIQTVNQLHGELKDYINKFKGVSTKYLQNYLYWFMLANKKMSISDKIKHWIWLSITYVEALKLLQTRSAIKYI
jgi:transposase-like protein